MYDIDKDVIYPLLKKDISVCKNNSFWMCKLYCINKTFEANDERRIQTVYRECAVTKPDSCVSIIHKSTVVSLLLHVAVEL
jgi:hypothetical protein